MKLRKGRVVLSLLAGAVFCGWLGFTLGEYTNETSDATKEVLKEEKVPSTTAKHLNTSGNMLDAQVYEIHGRVYLYVDGDYHVAETVTKFTEKDTEVIEYLNNQW